MNVLAGKRYELVPQEIKEYVRGQYGRSPAPINPAVKKAILGSDKEITCRPADLMQPMLPNATEGIDPALIHNEEDIISYCLFPQPALDFFKWRHLPPEERPPSPAALERKKQDVELKEEEKPAPPPRAFLAPSDYEALHELINRVHDLKLNELTIRRDDLALTLKADGVAPDSTPTAPAKAAATASAKPAPKAVHAPKAAAPAAAPAVDTALTIKAPLGGNFYASGGPGKPPFVKVGDVVKAGQPVCIVEAMKLFNEIKAPCDAKITGFLVEPGKPVKKDDPMIAYEKV
jgi:oxaloacetate decarboxylase alpha subunit